MAYLDRFGALDGMLERFREAYSRYGGIKGQIEALRLDEEEKERLRDRLSYRIEELDKAALRRQMEEIYRDLGATYLYSILYRIHASGKGDGQLCRIRQYNQWDMEDRASLDPAVTTGPNPNVQSIWRG